MKTLRNINVSKSSPGLPEMIVMRNFCLPLGDRDTFHPFLLESRTYKEKKINKIWEVSQISRKQKLDNLPQLY
jgi:hypothetical protein